MSGGKSGKPTCPSCGKAASGNFCQNCGASLGGRFCNKCGAKVPGGAGFCNQCGAPAKGGSGPQVTRKEAVVATVGGSNAAWWAGGAVMFALILIVGWTMTRPAGPAVAPGGGAPTGMPPASGVPATGQSTLDLSTMTPREAADRLFDRVMRTIAAGDTAGAVSFQPMAVQAYQAVEPLDLDGLFHQSLLEMLVDPSAALATAERILAVEPDHILGLGAAAEAALGSGDEARASEMYAQIVEVYGAQATRPLVEYQGHTGLMTQYLTAAQAFLAGR